MKFTVFCFPELAIRKVLKRKRSAIFVKSISMIMSYYKNLLKRYEEVGVMIMR